MPHSADLLTCSVAVLRRMRTMQTRMPTLRTVTWWTSLSQMMQRWRRSAYRLQVRHLNAYWTPPLSWSMPWQDTPDLWPDKAANGARGAAGARW